MNQSEWGFTLIEILVSSALLVAVATSSFVLIVGAKQLSSKPPNHSEAALHAGTTFEILRNYVHPSADSGNANYHLDGDATTEDALFLYGGLDHSHDLPSGTFRDALGGTRTYVVTDVDLNGDGTTDYKSVTVTIQWNDPT